MENKETMKKGQILEDLVSQEGYQIIDDHIQEQMNRIGKEIIGTDFKNLEELFGWIIKLILGKGELAALTELKLYPAKIIAHKKSLEKEAKLKEEKEKKKKKGK